MGNNKGYRITKKDLESLATPREVECEHNWKLINDNKMANTGYFTFVCAKCLKYVKKKRPNPEDYEEIK